MFGSHRDRRSQAEALVRGLLDAAGVGLCVLDDGARVVLANEAWLRAFGLTAAAAAGRDLREIFLPSSISLHHALEEARAGKAVDLPLHRQVSETAETWIEGRIAPLALEHGPGLLHTAVDVTKRKRASDALYRSEGELRISLANATIGFARATPAGRFLEVNPAYCAITGFTMDELRCKAALDLSHPDDRPELERRLGRMLRGEIQDFVMECRLARKDGGVGWARKSFSVVRSSGGAPQWIISLVEDVTERKRAEQALRESEQRFRLALGHAPISMAVQDRDLRFVWAYNQRTFRPEQLLGKRDADVFRPDEAAHLEAIKRRVLAEDVELREQLWIERPGGPLFLDVTFAPIHDEEGAVVGVGSATMDLTALKRAEERLREEEARISAICEHAPVGVALMQLPGNVYVKVNEAFLRLHDVRREDVLGRTADDVALIEASERARVLEAIARDGSVHGFLIRKRTRGGEERQLSVDVDPLDVGGKPFLLAMVQDRGPVPPA